MIKSEGSLKSLEKDIETLLPEKGDQPPFSKYFDKYKERLFKEGKVKIVRATKDCFANVKDKVNDIRYKNNYSEVNAAIAKLTSDFNKNSMRDLQEEVESIFASIQEKIEDSVDKYLVGLELDKENKERLKDETLELVKDYKIDLEDISYEPPEIGANMAKDYTKTTIEVVIGLAKTPQSLISIGVGLILLSLPASFLGMNLPFRPLGGMLIAGTIIFGLFLDNSAKKKNFNDSKNNIIDKLIGSFDRQKIEDDALNMLYSTTNDLLKEIDDNWREEITDYGRDLKIVKDTSKEFKSKIENLNKYITRQIEKLEISKA